jgi:hypothetical protein
MSGQTGVDEEGRKGGSTCGRKPRSMGLEICSPHHLPCPTAFYPLNALHLNPTLLDAHAHAAARVNGDPVFSSRALLQYVAAYLV